MSKENWLLTSLQFRMDDVIDHLQIDVDLKQVLRENRIETLKDLIAYYLRNADFTGLQNIKPKYAQTLTTLCIDLMSPVSSNTIYILYREISGLDDDQSSAREQMAYLIRMRFDKLKSTLSVRAQNVLRILLVEQHNNLQRVLYVLHSYYPDYTKLQRVGAKTSIELREFYKLFSEIGQKAIFANKRDRLVQNIMQIFPQRNDNVVRAIVGQCLSPDEKRIDVIGFISILIDRHILSDIRQTLLLKCTTDYFTAIQPKTLAELGDILGLSGERVRQLSKPAKLTDPLWNAIERLAFSVDASGVEAEFPGIRVGDAILCIDAEEINRKWSTKFSQIFLSKLVVVFKPEYKLISDHGRCLKNSYLLHEKVALPWNPLEWICALRDEKEKMKYESRRINLRQRASNIDLSPQIEEVYAFLLKKEFSVDLKDGYFTFPGRQPYKKQEILEFILNRADKPLHVDEVFLRSQQKFPGAFQKIETLRRLLQNKRNLFVLCGRSIYGLKEWESRKNIAGGTIMKVIIDFLKSTDEPQHVSKIAKYVMQFRNTTPQSISGLIALDKKNRIIMYGNGFYGLVNHHDPVAPYPYKKITPKIRSIIKSHFLSDPARKFKITDIKKKLLDDYGLLPVQVEYVLDSGIEHGHWQIIDGVLVKA